MANATGPIVGILMGSKTDWEHMAPAKEVLEELGVAAEARIISAHRAPDVLFEYVAEAEKRGLEVLIAGAGGAAHLPGMIAAKTLLPVLGVPVPSTSLGGLDALLAIVQMPKGTPVATMAIGKAGAANAALFAVQLLAAKRPELKDKLKAWKDARRAEMLKQTLP
jgi:5-(carboxyamino)imidazole ribonucleotide mutase